MQRSWNTSWAFLLAILMVGINSDAMGETHGRGEAIHPIVAVAPLGNQGLNRKTAQRLENLMYKEMDDIGIEYITSTELRPVLRANRIRSRGYIGLEGAKKIAENTGAEKLLLGSWEIGQNQGVPEVSFSFRLLDLDGMKLVAAASSAGTGEDNLGVFEKGRILGLEPLAKNHLKMTLKELFHPNSHQQRGVWESEPPSLIIVGLNNYSEWVYASEALENILLSELLSAGYVVIEPGFVREFALRKETAFRGGIDRENAEEMARHWGVDGIISGTVDHWEYARGSSRNSVPEAAFGLRLINPNEGCVVVAKEIEGAGDDHDGLFWQGRIKPLGRLASEMVRVFVQAIQDFHREDIAHDSP